MRPSKLLGYWAVLSFTVVALCSVSPAGADEGRLEQLWDRFESWVTTPACFARPEMREQAYVPSADGLGSWGVYYPSRRLVLVKTGTPDVVAFHEFAHHYWHVCHIADRPAGRRFLAAAGLGVWDGRARERFATTFTWVLTGQLDHSGNLVRGAAWTLAPRVDDPNLWQRRRLGWGL